ncbi:MAG: hypothetical protein Ta2E_12330 [Mycoplasmoidaceae bacterium]|nr:MAG: hypothetical protein Ta2E_12330 [Mycoplasmoidaceae bacterium]
MIDDLEIPKIKKAPPTPFIDSTLEIACEKLELNDQNVELFFGYFFELIKNDPIMVAICENMIKRDWQKSDIYQERHGKAKLRKNWLHLKIRNCWKHLKVIKKRLEHF